MVARFRRTLRALSLAGLLVVTWAFAASVNAQEIAALQPRMYTPLVMGGGAAITPAPPSAIPNDWLGRVNSYRALAGVSPVASDATLNENCSQHARYMAENKHLTHAQDPSKPFASAAGQLCAKNGNAWMGGGTSWTPADSIDSWMGSVGHRLWLIYPTTPVFGYGFHTAANNQAAAIDVLSRINLGADGTYSGWPVRYPAAGQVSVPATRYPVTLLWPYSGTVPQLAGTSLRTQAGVPVAHSADTNLPVGHKGVQIIPSAALPDNTVFVVDVSGTYRGAPFNLSWSFSTGDAAITAKGADSAQPERGVSIEALDSLAEPPAPGE